MLLELIHWWSDLINGKNIIQCRTFRRTWHHSMMLGSTRPTTWWHYAAFSPAIPCRDAGHAPRTSLPSTGVHCHHLMLPEGHTLLLTLFAGFVSRCQFPQTRLEIALGPCSGSSCPPAPRSPAAGTWGWASCMPLSTHLELVGWDLFPRLILGMLATE